MSIKKKVAVLGGAFDPIHLDHIKVAHCCLDFNLCDEVWFVPSPNRWDKTLIASPEDRFEMLKIATKGESRFILSDLEIAQGDYRGSYVFLCNLKEKFSNIDFRLLTGADTYENIPHWRDPMNFFGTNYNGTLLLKTFSLIIFARKGYLKPDIKKHKANGYADLFWLGAEHNFEGVYSSTAIRKALLCGEEPKGLDSKVYEYIKAHGLYKI